MASFSGQYWRSKVTASFEALKEGPQTEIDIAVLAPDERLLVRIIQIRGTAGVSKRTSVGQFIPVYYLVGDEKRAATHFVDLNREALESIDFSTRNLISTSVDRTVYDWILHALGERTLEQYETVVIERRNGVVWCIGRQTFEETPLRRYTEAGTGSAKVDGQRLALLYESQPDLITTTTLNGHPAVGGDAREILDAFRQAPQFECTPTTADGDLAVRKTKSSGGADP